MLIARAERHRRHLRDVRLPRAARIPCRLTIQPRKGRVVYGHGVAIRQLYKGDEVGRVVWQFAPEAKLRDEGIEK